MGKIKKFYCVGNAHIDPVWMWRWQEGSCEAKATIRSALDRIKEYPEFKFVCACSSVFEWIEEYDPDMFKEVQQRVSEGRFVIVGGWYVQPDCNLPSGEGFVRQGLYAQWYFKEKFGVTAKTGYNVDSFGHNAMIPQILKKSGMEQYTALRPNPSEKDLPSHVFRWRSPDGSEVLFGRILRGYNTVLLNVTRTLEHAYADNPETMRGYMDMIDEMASDNWDSAFFFYGVGNHGGGPTKKNIENLRILRERDPDTQYIMSTTEDFFDALRPHTAQLPVVQDDLQHHASGCYSAVSAIKNGVRRAEWAMFGAENFAMLTKQLIGKPCPAVKEFARAWKNILFAHFHDSLGGCSSKAVYEDEDIFLKETLAMAQRTENNALQSLSWKIDTSDADKGIPIILFNPHSFDIETTVTISKRVEVLYDRDGNEICTQLVRSPDSRCRKKIGDTIFCAKIPAMGYNTYYFNAELPDYGFTPYYFPEGKDKPVYQGNANASDRTIENEFLRITFSYPDGCISSMYDKKAGKELLSGKGAVPIVIDEYGYDTWAHNKLFFDNEIGKFCDATITVLDSGPLRAQIKIESFYGKSKLTQYFTLHEGSPMLEVTAKIDWHEQHKMLKLRFPTTYIDDPHAFYEIPYGVFERSVNGEEEPGQSWIAVKQNDEGLALINNNKYSFSIKENEMNLTVVRSPYYIDHARGDQNDQESEFTDQGEHIFRYALMPIRGQSWAPVIRQARLFNLPPTMIMENNHSGILSDFCQGLSVSTPNVVVSAWKQAENGKGIILRAYETDGIETRVCIKGEAMPYPLETTFLPYSIQTYYLEEGKTEWREVMLTEFDYQ